MATYQQGVCHMDPGDALLLFSDGVTEPVSPNADEEFGEDRLAQVLAGLRDQDAQSIIAAINQKVDDFTGGAPPADDITLVVAKLLPS
jgi:sigma-B regulation protein RsbU (phosphoserine phosphatase)